LPLSFGLDKDRRLPPAQRAEAQAGRLGKTQERMGLRAHQDYRRSEHTRDRSGWGIPSSKHRKLAQRKAAAEGSRRGYRIQVGGHNLRNPWDFGARGPQRATGKSPMVERRTSVNRSPCGRRTSLEPARLNARRLADSIPGLERMFYNPRSSMACTQAPTIEITTVPTKGIRQNQVHG
jgi:hypothetical protein